MRKKISVLLLAFVSLLILTACTEKIYITDGETARVELVSKIEKSVVAIEVTKIGSTSLGSGVIFKKDSGSKTYYVLTNKHVVEDAVSLKIYIGGNADSNAIEGKVVAMSSSDKSFDDIAVVSFIDSKNNRVQPIIPYNDKNSIIVTKGQTTFAIGTPMSINYYNNFITGTVSNVTEKWIIHQAPINPGNSGGPLFDSKGNVIGLNTSREKDAINISQAININYVAEVLRGLLD